MEQNKLQKKIKIVVAGFVAIGLLLLFGMSTARYGSQVVGNMEYAPALFNTVILGDLIFKTEANTEYIETDGKLMTSIDVRDAMLFGATTSNDDLKSNERMLRPGSVIAIPITITNGTSMVDDLENGLVRNLAGTDIAYTMNLITTTNIPLEYDVYEYTTIEQLNAMKQASASNDFNYRDYLKADTTTWGTKLETKKHDIQNSELIGYSRTREIWPKDYKELSGDDTQNNLSGETSSNNPDKKFFLRLSDTDTEHIAVHRYMLVIYWKDYVEPKDNSEEAKLEAQKATDELRSIDYMKEIDIIEVRLEVESWVEDDNSSSLIYDEATTSVIRLEKTVIGDETYYALPSGENAGQLTASTVYGRSTIPFYATRKMAGSDKEYYLDFVVTNETGNKVAQWDSSKEQYVVASEDISSLKNGKVAIAVPVQETMGTVNDYNKEFTYKLKLKGDATEYTGTATGRYITTAVWDGVIEEGSTIQEYKETSQNAYQIIEFDMTLKEFEASKVIGQELRLVVTTPSANTSFDNKDDFKIFVYQGGTGSED